MSEVVKETTKISNRVKSDWLKKLLFFILVLEVATFSLIFFLRIKEIETLSKENFYFTAINLP